MEDELSEGGWRPTGRGPDGVLLEGSAADLALLNLRLACASRVLVTVGSFRATALGELERKAADLDWAAFLHPGDPVRFRVTCRKSRLYHTGAVAERLVRAAAVRVPGLVPAPGEDVGGPTQMFVARVHRDRVTVRADASGEHLHRRGYRLATGKAPLRETLAAGLLRLAGWSHETPLVDPLCGSGTLVVEAALRACRIAPGASRRFAFERWPGTNEDVVESARADARAHARSAPAPLLGSDRDAGAIEAARANADRAGVGFATRFEVRPISEAAPPPDAPPGLLIANPPWGRRVGGVGPLRDLHARLGQVGRRRFAGWTFALFSPSAELVGHADRRAERVATIPSGGVSVGLWVVPEL